MPVHAVGSRRSRYSGGTPPGPRSFTATFATENPLSQGGSYLLGQTDGVQWGDFKAASGKATGLRAKDVADNTALVKGPWANNQFAQGTVWRGATDPTYFPEIELRLRSNLSTNVSTGYEIAWSAQASDPYFIAVRWNGPYDDYAYLTNQHSSIHEIQNGDVVRAEIRGSQLLVYRNSSLVFQLDDVTLNDVGTFKGALYTSGSPGFGTNANSGGDAALDQYGFSAFSAGEL